MKVITYLTALVLFVNLSFAQRKGPEMILVEGGTFSMGNDYSSNPDERPEHKVTLNSFYISKYEVTVESFVKFCKVVGIPAPQGDPYNPVTNITWESSIMYCNWLSSTQGYDRCFEISRDSSKFRVTFDPSKNGYRLPSEAEWEFAARGGIKTKHYPYSGGYKAGDVSWNNTNSGNREHEVGTKRPNELGIYDMTGNCMEWCWDWYKYEYYAESDESNPFGPETGVSRVCRGGHRMCKADVLRNTRRFNLEPNNEAGLTGIRLVRNQ